VEIFSRINSNTRKRSVFRHHFRGKREGLRENLHDLVRQDIEPHLRTEGDGDHPPEREQLRIALQGSQESPRGTRSILLMARMAGFPGPPEIFQNEVRSRRSIGRSASMRKQTTSTSSSVARAVFTMTCSTGSGTGALGRIEKNDLAAGGF